MNCLICNKSSEKSLCDDCSNKKRCKECNTSKSNTNFYIYKNGKMYNSCKVCFNKKVRCEFCNKELKKSYLRSHIKKQHYKQHYNYNQHYNQHTGGDLLPRQLSLELQRELPRGVSSHSNNNNNAGANAKAIANDDNNSGVNETNRTLIVGPSFCGKTHLLLNKLRLIRYSNNLSIIAIICSIIKKLSFPPTFSK